MSRLAGLLKQVFGALVAVGVVFVALIVVAGVYGRWIDRQEYDAVARANRSAYPAPTVREDWRYPPRAGVVGISAKGIRLAEEHIRKIVHKYEPAARSYTFSNRVDHSLTLVVAPAVDGTLHSPQAFMLGQAPYRVEQAWMPLYALSERMRYQPDKQQFQGRDEVWLTTLQAWSRAKGDCEDHAILLADWLIEIGLDARVVLGKHRREGHAWVVVFKDGREYLLEATLKEKAGRWSVYPLAGLLPDYHPEMMFNRQTLWVNTGSALTVNYAGPRWRPALTFGPV